MPKLGDRLNAARRRQFVGRSSELALFQSALTADDLPFYVLHIFGPGGVGKSTLLSAFATQCQTSHVIPIMLDARDIDPTPGVFTEALRLALNLSNDEAPLAVLAALAARPQRHAILIDTYEAFAPLDNWLRDSFLPQLPENTLVVLAGREPPATAWQADPGWSALVRVVPLRNLSPDESRAFLAQRNIPLDQHPAVLSFTHGFPLALALVAETFAQRRELSGEFQPGDAPDIVKTLLERFVQKVPGPAHRAALEACALVRVMTESLLGDMLLTGEGAHGLFEWLRSLSFIDAGHDGLFPHDLAREALIADVRWRNPDWYAELHKRARAYYTTRIAHTTGLVQQRLLFDLIFLHRDNAVVRPFLEWRASGNTTIETVRPAELEDLIGLVQKLEGDESARYAAHWFARQPQALQLLRDPEGGVAGFVMLLSLNQASLDDLRFDPGTHAVWSYLQKTAPLRSGEIATLFRFWLARDTYQAVSPTQSLIFVNIVRHYLTTPGLAYTFFPAAEPDFWSPMFAYANLRRLPAADFEVGGRRYGLYGHDWRSEPPAAWLSLLAEREIAAGPIGAPPPQQSAPLIVLSEADFASAVREALRDYAQPDLMQANPLLRSRLVVDRSGPQAETLVRVNTLRSIIQSAAEALQATPRDAKLYRALHHTYFKPAPSQERAAEILDVPFSTFRRHLTAGVARLTDALWQRELGSLDTTT